MSSEAPLQSSGRGRHAPKGRFRNWLAGNALLRHYLWEYRRLLGIGLLSLLIVDVIDVLPPIFLKEAVDVAIDHRPVRLLGLWALAYLGVALVQGLGRYGWRMYLVRASILAGGDLRKKYADHLFSLSSSFYDKRRIGDLMSLATNDVDAVRMAIGAGLLTFADAFFYFATVPIAMAILSPKLTLLAFAPLPIIPWLVMRNEREIHTRFEKVQDCYSELAAMAQEDLGGIRVVKAFAREDVQLGRFRRLGEKYIRLNLSLARVQSAFGPTLDFAMSLGLVLLIFVGGRSVILGALTLGTFVAFQRYIQKMVWPMAAFGMAISFYQRAVASSGRMEEILALSSDVPEPALPLLPEGAPQSDGSSGYHGCRGWKTRGGIEFRDLTFRFPGSDATALSGVSLTIEPGERVAFIGTIGSGKSALLGLVPRLYPVGRGMLFVDGVDVNDWPLGELRKQVGYVSQDIFLFSETVLENVALGLFQRNHGAIDESLTKSIQGSTHLASVHDEVLSLTEGYQTLLGERGVNLSGGQKQRLTIARALAKEPAILVLDDALSSVDSQTEERILRSLRSRPGRNTEVIAAHRISTIRDADRIVVLEQGRIRQVGDHAKLLQDRMGPYFRFYEQQRLKEDLEKELERISDEVGANATA